ncbi:hypothetical protein DFH27DRAFT_391909 [Peziza echinospora]|nr:hypothetical protein DFH27DRAFT_391909 [Peziza echinospora]
MVTGIETAGLVLGAFPMAIECIKLCMGVADKVNGMRAYKLVLEDFMDALELEKFDFEQLCTELLSPYCKAEEIKLLLENSNAQGDPWAADHIQDILERQLTAQSKRLFLKNMRKLDDELRTLADKLKIDSTFTSPSFKDKQTYKRVLAQLIPAFKSELNKESREKQIKRVQELNRRLRTLLPTNLCQGGTMAMTWMTVRPKLSQMDAQKKVDRFILTRRQAISAFSVLRENIYSMCKCAEISHGISLQLQWQYISSPAKLSSDFTLTSDKQQRILTILISKEGNIKPWSWSQIQLEPLMMPEPPNQAISTPKRLVRFGDSTPQAEGCHSQFTVPKHDALQIPSSKSLTIPSLTLTPSIESLTLPEAPTRTPTPTASIKQSTVANLPLNRRQEGTRGANTTNFRQSQNDSSRQPLLDFKILGWLF